MNQASGGTMSGVDAPVSVLATDPALLERYQPGPIALAILVILGGTLWLLHRSMKRQLDRIDFDPTATDDAGRMRDAARGDSPPSGGTGPGRESDRRSEPEGPDHR